MTRMLLAALALAVAAPAAAVTITGTTVAGGNSVTPVTTEPGTLEVDFGISSSSPIRLDLLTDSDETTIAFNANIDSFLTTVGNGAPLRRLTLSLGGGASFATIGSIAPAFSTANGVLDASGTIFTINFDPAENFGLVLGDIGNGGSNFGIDVANLQAGSAFTLSLGAAVPEPASWAMLVAGFGLVGGALRRRSGPATVAA